MNHIVERILDGLPVYIKEDYPVFTELLRTYYAWQAEEGGSVNTLYTHDSRLDVDRSDARRVLAETGWGDVPTSKAQAFVRFARAFAASKGSRQGFADYFGVFHAAAARTDDTAAYVFEPSAARVKKWRVITVVSTQRLPSSGILAIPAAGAQIDVVAAVARRTDGTNYVYELTASLTGGVVTTAAATYAGRDVQVKASKRVDITAGQNYGKTDKVVVVTATQRLQAVFTEFVYPDSTGFTVTTAGSAYVVGDAIVVSARGWRGEVSGVDVNGAIVSTRLLDRGDNTDGEYSATVVSRSGQGAAVELNGVVGRPKTLRILGELYEEVLEVVVATANGSGLAYTTSRGADGVVTTTEGFNGVIGQGTVVTDSAAWMDSSYRVITPVSSQLWAKAVKELMHSPGRFMSAVKAITGGGSDLPGFTASTQLLAVAYAETQLRGGEGVEISVSTTAGLSTDHSSGEVFTPSLDNAPGFTTEMSGGEELVITTLTTD